MPPIDLNIDPDPADFERLHGAVVVAGEAPERAPFLRIGVRRGDDTTALFGTDVFRHRWSTPKPLSALQDPITHKAGRAFYAGVAGPIFGHLITQSLGRLWAAPPDVPIVFVSSYPSFDQLPSYFITLIRALGIDNPIELVTSHSRFDELIVAKDHFNLERRPCIAPIYAEWLTQRRQDIAVDDGLFLYISRARLGETMGQYLQEQALQEALRAQGYQIIYPEELPISQQIDLYLRAKKLIFADGSAVHLWSLFASPAQMAAVVCRRAPHLKMKKLLAAMPQANVEFFDCRLAEFSGSGRGANSTVALLDMDQLWRRLRRRGFHNKRHLYFPIRIQMQDWLAAISAGQDPLENPPFQMDPTSAALLARRPKVIILGVGLSPQPSP